MAFSSFLFISEMDFYKKLTDETKEQTEDLESDIRVQAAIYYLNDFSPNNFARVFGNGEPYYQGSEYIKYVQKIEGQLGLYSADVGYIGLYSKFGVLALVGYLILIVKTILLKLPEESEYLRYFLYFIFLISLIISAPFNNDFIPSIIIALYLASLANKKHRETNI